MWEFVILFVTLLYIYQWWTSIPKNFPPGPPVLPYVGSIPFIDSMNFHFWLEKKREKYGPVIGLRLGPSLNSIAVCGYKEVVEVLKGEAFNARMFPGDLGDRHGVMFSNGGFWKEQRRFTLRHLRDFGFGTNYISDLIAEEVKDFSSSISGQKVLEGSGLFNTSAVNIIWAMVAGRRFSYDDPDFKVLLHWLHKWFRQGNINGGINNFPTLKKFISLFHTFDDVIVEMKLTEFFKRTIEEHKVTKESMARDLIDSYLNEIVKHDEMSSFSERTLTEVCKDLFSAGTESSSNTVSFALLYMLLYPKWQDELVAEIEEVLDGKTPMMEDRYRLHKTEAFLAEVQRCNTIAPISIPRATVADTTLNGYDIPQGTFVSISIWACLQDKEHWGDPENFRPERHLDSDGKLIKDPYMLIFGMGPRVCLGENLARNFAFLFLVSLLQRFKFSQPKGEPTPSTICLPGFTTAPQHFKVVFEPR